MTPFDDGARPVSPDGRWVWNGSGDWVPVTFFPVLPASSTLRPVSPDGRWVWNGRRWEEACEPMHPGPGAPTATPAAQFGRGALPPGLALTLISSLPLAILWWRWL